MQELLSDPQLASRRRMSALQTAHSGGLRISADFSGDEPETGTG